MRDAGVLITVNSGCFGLEVVSGQFHVPPVTAVFYRPEAQGRYLGEPVPMAVNRVSNDWPETISISLITRGGEI